MVATVEDNHLVLRCATRKLLLATLRGALHQNLKLLAYIALVALLREGVLQLDNLRKAAGLDIFGDIITKVPLGEGTGALRILEHIGEVVAHLAHKRQCCLVLLLRFVCKARDKVGGDGAIGHIATDSRNTLQVPLASILTIHTLEHLRRARLSRQVDSLADIGHRRHSLQQLVADILGVRCGETNTQQG